MDAKEAVDQAAAHADALGDGVTANTVGAIRAAAVLQIHSRALEEGMHAVASAYALHAIQELAKCPGVYLHGAEYSGYTDAQRLPVVSFNVVVKHPKGQGPVAIQPLMLHPRFVAAALHDNYGVQVSAGLLS
jgi:selenocysteine lyase/cysteine desulfurase